VQIAEALIADHLPARGTKAKKATAPAAA